MSVCGVCVAVQVCSLEDDYVELILLFYFYMVSG